MQAPPKKKMKPGRSRMIILVPALLVFLFAAAFGLYAAKREQAVPYRSQALTLPRVIKESEPADIIKIDVKLKDLEDYTLTHRSGSLYLDGASEPANAYMASAIFDSLMPLYASDTLSENPQEYMDYLDDFGLADPSVRLDITYSGGEELIVSIGSVSPECTQRYMLVSGDERLYLCYAQFPNAFEYDYRLLSMPDQPALFTPDRIDRIAVYNSMGGLSFEFRDDTPPETRQEGSPEDRFRLTWPVSYPVSAEAFKPILTALGSFVLGPRYAQDTPAARAAYGLDKPEYRLVVHQAAGSGSVLNADGMFTLQSFAQTEHIFDISRAKDEFTRFTASEGYISVINGFQLSFVYHLDPLSMLTRNPFDIPLECVLSFRSGGDRYDFYRTLWTESDKAASDGSDEKERYHVRMLVNDSDGDYNLFKDRYASLQKITVSGRLPEGFSVAGAPHTVFEVTTADGTREVSLAEYDMLHDAVGIDGVYLFYLVKGSLAF